MQGEGKLALSYLAQEAGSHGTAHENRPLGNSPSRRSVLQYHDNGCTMNTDGGAFTRHSRLEDQILLSIKGCQWLYSPCSGAW